MIDLKKISMSSMLTLCCSLISAEPVVVKSARQLQRLLAKPAVVVYAYDGSPAVTASVKRHIVHNGTLLRRLSQETVFKRLTFVFADTHRGELKEVLKKYGIKDTSELLIVSKGRLVTQDRILGAFSKREIGAFIKRYLPRYVYPQPREVVERRVVSTYIQPMPLDYYFGPAYWAPPYGYGYYGPPGISFGINFVV